LQALIRSAMKESGQRSMSRRRLVTVIAHARGVRQLRGTPREQFQKNVNAAIGVLLKKSPPQLIRHGTTNSAVALPRKEARKWENPRSVLLRAIRDRILLVRFTCVSCGRIAEVTDLNKEDWCDSCLTSFHESSSTSAPAESAG